MLNIHTLERQWVRYKIKKYLPIAVISSGILTLSIVGFVIWPLISFNSNTTGTSEKNHLPVVQSQNTQPENVTSTATKPQSDPLPDNTSIAQHTQQDPSVEPNTAESVMEPSLGFIQSLEDDTVQHYYETEQVPSQYSRVDNWRSEIPAESATVSTPSNAIQTERISETVKTENHPSVSITPTDAKDLADVIKRFQANKNPALSLFLAKRYYDLNNYKESYDYALKTNEIDSNIEESWLIFSKSLVKLGQKEEALKVLKSYLNHSPSLEAKALFDDINTGRFQ